jgi:hypothetical protein
MLLVYMWMMIVGQTVSVSGGKWVNINEGPKPNHSHGASIVYGNAFKFVNLGSGNHVYHMYGSSSYSLYQTTCVLMHMHIR